MIKPDEEHRIRELNKQFHARQASTYDTTHQIHAIAADILRMRISKKDRVLDLGTGTGFVRHILPSKNIIGIDISRSMLNQGADDGAKLIEAIAGQIPLKSDSIDKISGRSVLHHLPDLDKVASECQRVLRPGGEVVIANEPKGMPLFFRVLERLKSRLGSRFNKQTGWKSELAEQFQTHVRDITQSVNYHEETGIDPAPFDSRFTQIARVEYDDDRLAFIWRNE
jgi:ubiquinone/menaquinone biosynthesis C-methylase UbiE